VIPPPNHNGASLVALLAIYAWVVPFKSGALQLNNYNRVEGHI